MSDINNMLVADWARYFHDIKRVKQRILFKKLGTKWGNLTEIKKQQLCDEIAAEIELLLQGKKPTLEYLKDKHFLENYHKTKDLARYGIFINEEERPKTNMQLLSISLSP